MADLLGVSVTGLRLAQSSLSTTGHNIANAGVDGFSRQRVVAETNPASMQGGSFVGSGVSVASVDRLVDSFVSEQIRTDTSLFGDLDVFNENISQLDRLLSDVSTGLSSGLESFFASMQNGADDPTSIPARQLIVSEAENLSDRFNAIYSRLDSIDDGIDTSINTAVSQINALTDNIAQLNQKIGDAIGTGGGAAPNDLLDQRDEAVRKLSELVGIQTYSQGFGQINVVVGSGQNLVVGTDARTLNIGPSAEDATKTDLFFSGGERQILVTDLISGGELGGLLRFQNDIMDDTYNQLGRIAVVLADSFNQQHQQGINLNDEFGENFFYDVNNSITARNRVIGNSDNAAPPDRVASLNIVDSSQILANDYEITLGAGGFYRINNLSTGEEVTNGLLNGALPASINFDGLELVFESGSFQDGDSFKLQPVRAGARDFSAEILNAESIAFGSPLLTDATIGNTGSGTINAGEVQSLIAADGSDLPLFSNTGSMDPPLLVRFSSPTTYDVLDNSDPGNPVHLDPPIANQRYVVGQENSLFSTDPGETMVQTAGELVGLPDGRTPVIGVGTPANGYPAEAISITQSSGSPGSPPVVQNIFTNINASARETASLLSNVAGVSASAQTYLEITDVQNLSLTSPLQVSLNGEELVEYRFDAGLGVNVISTAVPDPTTEPDAFNDYLADKINTNVNLSARGIYAVAGIDPISGISELRVVSPEGDDLQVALEADAGSPDSLRVGDGTNPVVVLNGNGAGTPSSIAVGGTIDVRLSDGVSLGTFPPNSLLFGDTTATDFARSTYLGIQASIIGAPDTGDTFTLDFNQDAASDNRNALLLGDLQSADTVGGGIASYSESYGTLVETIGIETASSTINRDASEQVLEQSTELRNSVSAVNLDEEAANLIKFEQVFSANAQAISVARDLFDRLINSF